MIIDDISLAHLARRDWLTDGPLRGVLPSYLEVLRSRRYARSTIGAYLRSLAHFSYWMTLEGYALGSVDAALIERFLRTHLPACTCPVPCRSVVNELRAALGHLLSLLSGINRSVPVAASPLATELERFRAYLRQTCGLAEPTCMYRIKQVGAFLRGRFGEDALEIKQLMAVDIDAFLHAQAARLKPSSCKLLCTSLHSYLRYRAMLGDDTRILSESLPAIANWPRRHPPKVLSEQQLERFLQAFVRTGLKLTRCTG